LKFFPVTLVISVTCPFAALDCRRDGCVAAWLRVELPVIRSVAPGCVSQLPSTGGGSDRGILVSTSDEFPWLLRPDRSQDAGWQQLPGTLGLPPPAGAPAVGQLLRHAVVPRPPRGHPLRSYVIESEVRKDALCLTTQNENRLRKRLHVGARAKDIGCVAISASGAQEAPSVQVGGMTGCGHARPGCYCNVD
jgi:hypothetical protein